MRPLLYARRLGTAISPGRLGNSAIISPMPTQSFDLTLELDLVLRSQGGDPARARPALRAMAAAMTERARPMLAPAVAYEILDIAEVRHERLVISPRVSLRSARLVQALGGAEQIAVAVCTIGPQLEEAVGAMFSTGQALEATVLDGVGSAAVEELSQRACRMFEDMARERGLMTSSPFSPGEPDWPLEGQRELFDLVPGEEIGVTLADTYLMRPLKSLSLVVGIGKNLSAGGSPCEFCSLNQVCRYRERKA
jgi:hypothetical protein